MNPHALPPRAPLLESLLPASKSKFLAIDTTSQRPWRRNCKGHRCQSTNRQRFNHVLHLSHLSGSVVNKPLESRRPHSLIVHDGLVGYYHLRRDGTAMYYTIPWVSHRWALCPPSIHLHKPQRIMSCWGFWTYNGPTYYLGHCNYSLG